jgi:hypothetical protein
LGIVNNNITTTTTYQFYQHHHHLYDLTTIIHACIFSFFAGSQKYFQLANYDRGPGTDEIF